mmetsp:Transcript_15904/g.26804  ORF Transcript_15904/g.26804 Transcript_15904/m.26804 type:complete len:202 (+) Transcript_15904:1-606(+)
MSRLLINQKTPQIVRGIEVDDTMRQKIKQARQKVLGLNIVVEDPEYDEEGNPVIKDYEDDDGLEHFDGIFNAHLLEEEYLDSQPYQGDVTFSDNSEENKQAEQHNTSQINKPRDEAEIQEDLKKHLNIDFTERDGEEENEDEDESVDMDQYEGFERQRGMSLIALENQYQARKISDTEKVKMISDHIMHSDVYGNELEKHN